MAYKIIASSILSFQQFCRLDREIVSEPRSFVNYMFKQGFETTSPQSTPLHYTILTTLHHIGSTYSWLACNYTRGPVFAMYGAGLCRKSTEI